MTQSGEVCISAFFNLMELNEICNDVDILELCERAERSELNNSFYDEELYNICAVVENTLKCSSPTHQIGRGLKRTRNTTSEQTETVTTKRPRLEEASTSSSQDRPHDDKINADTDESLTYRELTQKTVDVALSLTHMGVRKGDVISICSEKRIEVMATILGICCAGATFSPTDISYGSAPLVHRVKIARPKIMFCSPTAFNLHKTLFDTVGSIEKYIVYEETRPEHASALKLLLEKHGGTLYKEFLTETCDVNDFLPVPVDGWKDYLFILFSSGTTGLPKGVPVTHLALLANRLSLLNESSKGAWVLNTGEWYNTSGLLQMLVGLWAGATNVYSCHNSHTDHLGIIQKYKIKYLKFSPSSVAAFIKSTILDDYDTSSVEGIFTTSTPIMAEQVQTVKQRLINLKGVYQVYGMTEAICVCTELIAPMGHKNGSVGIPAHGVILKVVDLKSRQPLGPRERGEICLKSITLTPGYLNVSHRDYMDSEGFYLTGDVGYYDEDKYFYIVDRIKELIKYNDISIAPAELESILLQHSAVHDVGIVGAPSKEYGEAPTAFVALQPGCHTTEEELVLFLESRITFRMKLAGGVRFVAKLPRNSGGKVDRNALRNMLKLKEGTE